MVEILEKQLTYWGKLIEKDLGKRVRNYAGAGAAGGLGAGLVAFLDAQLKSGIDIVVETIRLKELMQGADLVITGEGRIDFQTAFGKTPIGVTRVARKLKIPVMAIGGSLADDAPEVYRHGIAGLAACITRDLDIAEALKHSKPYLAAAAERVARCLLVGRKL
jgi:glycerate kinase